MQIGGIHHVTAVTANAPENLDFYTRVLGLRLVKRTVNQDDVSAYHLFYGDEIGRAGTELTFFDWARAAPARRGTEEVACTALRVHGRDSLVWWAERLSEAGIAHGGVESRRGGPPSASRIRRGSRSRWSTTAASQAARRGRGARSLRSTESAVSA